ncbi:MAG: CPBP family intramembrane metalloprotease [Verrucomicrobiaceae bacterium]|nr:MAG: CPBP family intramembrane metalloprotease [Verrucomicrobiaceae bacterium]
MAIGAWEELIFRGYALSRCAAHPRFAICVSVLGFAFLHMGHAPANILTVFFVGIGFDILRVVSGSLGWCILIHGLTNVPADGAQPPDWAIIPMAITTTVATLGALWCHPVLGGRWASTIPIEDPPP